MLIAQRLKMLAVHNKTSNEVQNSQRTQPNCHEPSAWRSIKNKSFNKTPSNGFYCRSPTEKTKTAGGITKMPTSQSATAKLMTNRLVTVLRRRVVMTDKITKVFPIIVIIINKQKSTISTIFVHGQLPVSAPSLFCSVAFIFNHRVERPKLITREEKPDTSELLLTDDFRMLIHGFLISIGGESAPADNLKRQTRRRKFYDS